MSIPSSLLQNSEWMMVAAAAAVLVIAGFVSLTASSRKVSRLAKKVEILAQEVGELRGLEDRRLLKELKSKHISSEKVEAPPLAHF
jgi:outer membrane murein-binding lipoprotein Lpp